MKTDNLKLYFLALTPNEPICTDIWQLKTEIKDRFNSKAALRSPPHITLHMPFQWKEEKEEVLINSLNNVAGGQSTFNVRLEDFGAFPPRVIYVQVIESELLGKVHHVIQTMARSDWHIYPKTTNSRPFHPHMTIAFRDLKKPEFYKAWKGFEDRKYYAEFTVLDLCLLKHNGKSWDIFHRASLSP
jgi:2'-5' RNA ligase